MVHSSDEHLYRSPNDLIVMWALKQDPDFLKKYYDTVTFEYDPWDEYSDDESEPVERPPIDQEARRKAAVGGRKVGLTLKAAYAGDLFDQQMLDLFIDCFEVEDQFAYSNLKVADDYLDYFVETMIEKGWYHALRNIDSTLWIGRPPDNADQFAVYLETARMAKVDPEIYVPFVSSEMFDNKKVTYWLTVIFWSGAPIELYEDFIEQGFKFCVPMISWMNEYLFKNDLDDAYDRHELFRNYLNESSADQTTNNRMIGWKYRVKQWNYYKARLAKHDNRLIIKTE